MDGLLPNGSIFVNALGWALLHSLWQGALISAALWLLLRMLGESRTVVRYNLSYIALIGAVGLFITTMVQEYHRLAPIQYFIAQKAGAGAATPLNVASTILSQSAPDSLISKALSSVDGWVPNLVWLYFFGIFCCLLRLLIGFSGIIRLRKKGSGIPGREETALFNRLKARMGLHGNVALKLSPDTTVPVLLGYFRPVVLLPVSILSTIDMQQLEAILLHELAHCKRQDYLLNLFQTVIETILFFNPFVWWMSAGIRREREYCCDDVVVAYTRNPVPYAAALAALEADRYAHRSLALAATGSTPYLLLNRIKRFTEMKRTPLGYGRIAATAVALLILGGCIIWLTPALAQGKKGKASGQKSTVTKIIIIDDQGNRKEYSSFDDMPKHDRKMLQETNEKEAVQELDENRSITALGEHRIPGTDEEQIQKDIDEAMKDAATALKQSGRALEEVDWTKINKEIALAMDEVAATARNGKEGAKMRKEIEEGLEEALRGVREAAEEAGNAADDVRRTRSVAHVYNHRSMPVPPTPPAPLLEPAPPALPSAPQVPAPPRPAHDYEAMLDRMHREGLIDRKGRFEIRKTSRDLYINDKAQPDAVKVRYRGYFSPGKVNISGTGNSLNVSEYNESN